MNLELADSHCHLDHSIFDADREEVLTRAENSGVRRFIVPATQKSSWSKLRALCNSRHNVFPAYGLHPCFMSQHKQSHLDILTDFLQRPSAAVAVGECGLDRVNVIVKDSDQQAQIDIFEAQLYLASKYNLPAIVHARGAVEATIQVIRKVRHYLGFGGAMTYPRASKIRKLVSQLPLECILLETDAPDQSDKRHHGERNEPAYLVNIFEVMCELRKESAETIAKTCSSNTEKLFNLTDIATRN